jgi:uracil-DNA glycosylase family 4
VLKISVRRICKSERTRSELILSNKELLEAVAAEVVVCTKCNLWRGRKKAVPGVGNPESRVLFIGEAPGQSEDLKGEPFVGAAGKFLDSLLSETGLSRADVFITNVVKCRPPGNRDPGPLEIETCTPYLNRQIGVIRPRFIVTLGNHSTEYIFSKATLPFQSITQARGRVYETSILGMKLAVFAAFHPAAALYSARYKKVLEEDFSLIRDELVKRGLVRSSS